MASDGTPRIFEGLSSFITFPAECPSKSTEPVRARTTFCPLSPGLMFVAPVTSCLTLLSPSPHRTVGKVSRSALGWRSTPSDLGYDDLVAIPDGARSSGLTRRPSGMGRPDTRTPATSSPASVSRSTRWAGG